MNSSIMGIALCATCDVPPPKKCFILTTRVRLWRKITLQCLFFSSASLPVSQRNNGTSCHLGNFLDEASTVIEFELFLKATKFNWREEKNWIGSYSVLHSWFFLHFEFFLESLSKLKSLLLRLQCQCTTVHLWALLFIALLFVSTGFVSNAFCKHCFL